MGEGRSSSAGSRSSRTRKSSEDYRILVGADHVAPANPRRRALLALELDADKCLSKKLSAFEKLVGENPNAQK